MASSIYNFDLDHLASAIADQVKARLALKQDTLQLDVVPTQNSTKYVNSGAVYNALNGVDLSGGGMSDADINALAALVIEELGIADPITAGNVSIDTVAAIQDKAEKALANEAVPYDSTATYSVGDVVLYTDNYTYKCKAATTAGTAPTNTTYWEKRSIGEIIDSLRTSFQVGCNTIVSAVTAKGQTPASNSPSDIATAIGSIEQGLSLPRQFYIYKHNSSTDDFILYYEVTAKSVYMSSTFVSVYATTVFINTKYCDDSGNILCSKLAEDNKLTGQFAGDSPRLDMGASIKGYFRLTANTGAVNIYNNISSPWWRTHSLTSSDYVIPSGYYLYVNYPSGSMLGSGTSTIKITSF